MNVPKRTERGKRFTLGHAKVWDAMEREKMSMADLAADFPSWGLSRLRRLLYGDAEPKPREVQGLAAYGVEYDMWTKPAPKSWRFPHERAGKRGAS